MPSLTNNTNGNQYPLGFFLHPFRGTARKSPPVCAKAAGVAVVRPYNLGTTMGEKGPRFETTRNNEIN